MLRIAVLGEIGSLNLGDDLGFLLLRDELFRSFRQLDIHVQIDYFTPARFSDLDNTSHQVVVTGCGTLLDARGGEYVRRLAQMQDRRTMVSLLGTGLSDPQHLPPTEEGQRLLERVLSRATKSWIRGQDGPDLLWLNGPIPEGGKRQWIGVNMGFAAFSCVGIDQIWWKLRTLIWDLRSKGEKVVLVSCWPNDNVWYRRDFPEERILQIGSSRASLQQLSDLKALVSFRGHLGLLGTCAGASVLPIVFSKKVEDMYGATSIRRFALLPWKDDWSAVVAEAVGLGPLKNEQEVNALQERVKNKIRSFAEEVRRAFQ